MGNIELHIDKTLCFDQGLINTYNHEIRAERSMEFINRIVHALTELHPTHPMFVHFPIALTGAAFLFILLAYWRKSAALEQTAFANIVLASISTIVAGITGYLDNLKNYLGDARNASTKIILAMLLFILTTGISIVRYRNRIYFRRAIVSYISRPMASVSPLQSRLHFWPALFYTVSREACLISGIISPALKRQLERSRSPV